VEGATGVDSVRRCQKLPLHPPDPEPASSEMDLLLAKAEPVSNSGSASVITQLRRGKTCVTAFAARERSENPQDAEVSEEGERGGAPDHGADQGEAGCPCSSGGPRWSRSPAAARGGPQARAEGYLKEAVTLWGPVLERVCWQDL